MNPKKWLKQRRERAEKRQAEKGDSIHTELEKKVLEMTKEARFLRETKVCRPIALLDRNEVQLGNLLGEGSFCEAFAVTGFKLREHEISPAGAACTSTLSSTSCSIIDEGIEDCRQLLSKTANRKGRPKYALKQLSINLFLMQGNMKEAAADLIIEANYMMRLDHPNILKIRGMTLGGSSAFGKKGIDGFFVIVDRLTGTLDDRIHRWKKEGRRHSLFLRSTILRKAKDALQIASALAYLHRRRIVFRDAKPSNVGYKDDGVNYRVQLFDFGFARELPTSKAEVPDDNEVFRMSHVGSPNYMAPEVILNAGKYNVKVDTYSWAITFYEMLTLKLNGHVANYEALKKSLGQEKRPDLSKVDLPSSIKELLQRSWQQSVSERATTKDVCIDLQRAILDLEASIISDPEDTSEESSDHLLDALLKKTGITTENYPEKKTKKKSWVSGVFRKSECSEATAQSSGFISHNSAFTL